MRLKELRKAQRYSQKHIAEMAGIQQAAVCRWESGQYDPKLSVALTQSAKRTQARTVNP